MFHVKLFFFTCNTTCLMLVNVHENHEQIYIIRYREWIFCYNNEIETCHNCNLLYFKYSTVSIHKQSRVIFLSLLILICYYRVFYLEVLRLKLTTSWLFIIPRELARRHHKGLFLSLLVCSVTCCWHWYSLLTVWYLLSIKTRLLKHSSIFSFFLA